MPRRATLHAALRNRVKQRKPDSTTANGDSTGKSEHPERTYPDLSSRISLMISVRWILVNAQRAWTCGI